MPKKKKNNAEPFNLTPDGEVLVKCPLCQLLLRTRSVPAHVRVIHEIKIHVKYDRQGKRKCYVCDGCEPLPGLFSTQLALDNHQTVTNHQ